jgi:hypothetical protein
VCGMLGSTACAPWLMLQLGASAQAGSQCWSVRLQQHRLLKSAVAGADSDGCLRRDSCCSTFVTNYGMIRWSFAPRV